MARLSLSFLGAFQAVLGQKIIANFRSANVQGLLVYLAMQADRPFPREVLATLFWPQETESAARANLRQSLYQLRKVLRDSKQERPFLLINRHTIQFNRDSETQLDVNQFVNALAQKDWATAVSHYSGELLPGFTCDSLEFEAWLRSEREQLHRQAIEALSRWTEQLLANGRFQQAQKAAQRQLELEPWREEGHQQLMLALALNGERSAALAQFETCRHLLAEEFGTEPSAGTMDLYERIMSGEEMAVRQDSAVLLQLHNLMAPTITYFGRVEEQAQLLKWLSQSDHRLITLVGEGGIGKSRLAQELAWQLRDQFRDGIWFVPLAGLLPLKDETELQDSIATTVAQALGHSLSGQQSPKDQLRSFLQNRQVLLVLDNFEHLLNGADIVLDWLQHAPAVSILCTSREPLGFMAESVYPLDQLPLPPPPPSDPSQWLKAVEVDIPSYASVQLFVDRAQRANGRFALNSENENEVAHICRLVAGIPLGLELAAASLRKWSLSQLISAIESSLGELATRLRDVPPRHRSLQAVFETSWSLLTAAEQQLFASLSIFRGGFTQTAAQAIIGVNADQINSLAEKSLLQTQSSRFTMQEHLRQFAVQKLADRRLAEVTNQHSAFYLGFVTAQEAALVGEAPQQAAQQIAADLDNIRAAWQTAVHQQHSEQLFPCLSALADFYQIRGLYREAEQRFGEAATQFTEERLVAHLLIHQAGARVRLSQYSAAIELIERALSLVKTADDQWAQGKLFIYWGEALWRQGSLAEAETMLNNGWEIAQVVNSRPLAGSALFHLGIVYDYKGGHEAALAYLDIALIIWRELNNRRQQGFTLNSLGAVAYRLPRHYRSMGKKALTEALAISRANGDLQGQSMALSNLSLIATEDRDFEAAQSYLVQSLQIVQFNGDQHGQALVYHNLGANAGQAGRWGEVERYVEKALQVRRHIGDRRGEAMDLKLLGDVMRANGRFEQALTYYQTAYNFSQQVGDRQNEKEVHQALEELFAESNGEWGQMADSSPLP